ncbi:MAG: hypothetical protein RBS08_05930, partial [Bdellovibrionales bacterium]|nr:hypothetical protein [Bdellovibrionales bacterium]
MSSASQVDSKPIQNKRELVEWFEKGCTPADKLLIGVEHEKPPFYLDNNQPVSFMGADASKFAKVDNPYAITSQSGQVDTSGMRVLGDRAVSHVE